MARSKRVSKAGLPAAGSVVEEKSFIPPIARGKARAAAPGGVSGYRILRTNEVDPYDAPVARASIAAIGAKAGPTGDAFKGTSRKAAKLAVAAGAADPFDDLRKLLAELPRDKDMVKRNPPITTKASSGRVAEEKRNVRVSAFLYAASREDDNDFHLIIGRSPGMSPSQFMTVELSGLPPKSSSHFTRLKKARDTYKSFFRSDLPGTTYDFYKPPIPVEIEGSLFFDMSHATGSKPGPKSLRAMIPTIWEIHPISKITLEP